MKFTSQLFGSLVALGLVAGAAAQDKAPSPHLLVIQREFVKRAPCTKSPKARSCKQWLAPNPPRTISPFRPCPANPEFFS